MWNSTMLVVILNICLLYLVYGLHGIPKTSTNQKVTFFAFERPNVVYFNKHYLKYLNVSSLRYSRRDPIHYVNADAYSNFPVQNNVTYSFYAYEFLSNTYKRSFVELHLKVCDMLEKDTVVGPFVKKALEMSKGPTPVLSCPFPPGAYSFHNFSLVSPLLAKFPFRKGRIYFNSTITDTKEVIAYAHIDFEIKEISVKS